MSTDDATATGGFADRTSSARRAVDWIIAVLLVLIGLAATGLGGVLVGVADREFFVDLVQEETVHSDLFTQAELVDIMHAGSWWGGVGVTIAGLAMVLAGVLVGLGRRRVDRLPPAEDPPTFVSNALLGAFVTGLTSFVPFSGLLGGGVSGYLESTDSWSGAIVGLAAGALLAAPIVIAGTVIAIGFVAEGLAVWGLLLLVALVFTMAFSIGVTAIGGALGSYIRGQS